MAGRSSSNDAALELQTLAGILRYSAGIIKRLRYAGGLMEFRAAASTGASYHIDLYLVCGATAGYWTRARITSILVSSH